jgi:hypothetical protein
MRRCNRNLRLGRRVRSIGWGESSVVLGKADAHLLAGGWVLDGVEQGAEAEDEGNGEDQNGEFSHVVPRVGVVGGPPPGRVRGGGMPGGLEDSVGMATQAVVTGVVLALGEEVVEGGAVVPAVSDLSGG